MVNFKAPTVEQVQEVLRRIPTPQLRRAFFERLENPLWVDPLAKAGAFAHPPEPEQLEDGLIRDVYWPEIDYLIRVATKAPRAVVDVFRSLSKSNNAWVRRAAFTVGASLPAEQAARLEPLFKAWAPTGFGWRTDPREQVTLAANLLQGGQFNFGKWLSNCLFNPGKRKGQHPRSLRLEDYWYEDGLPRIVPVLDDEGLSVVLPWLVRYERVKGHVTANSDLSNMARDSIRIRGDSYDGVEQGLIDAVRDLAVRAMLVDAAQAKSTLLTAKMVLGRKITLFALAQSIARSAADPVKLEQLLPVSRELLFDEASLADACRIEYAELVRAAAPLSPEILRQLPEAIDRGSGADRERLQEWLGRDNADEADVTERVEEYQARWRHRLLAAIGVETLPEQLQTELRELDSRFGVIDAPLDPQVLITSWTGPNSPIAHDEMALMGPAELVAHLESWHAQADGWGPGPSHEGQARELTDLLTTNPTVLAGVEDLAERLRPTYLRAVLRGWEAAHKAGLSLDWAQVAELISAVLDHEDESRFPVEGDSFDDDADFHGAKQAAVGLLEELVKKREPPTLPSDALPRFAEILISGADDEPAWSRYAAHDSSGSDPLTISLNWQWSMRLRGLIHLMSHGNDTEWYGDARSALERELARDDPRGASRAVLGEGLGRLLSADPDWLESKIRSWFGDDSGIAVDQQIALTTAMAVHHYHPTLYTLLGPAMIAAVWATDPLAAGWRAPTPPLQRIGEWMIEAIIRGQATLDDPVVAAFFTAAPAEVRGEAIAHTAWSFMHAETVAEDVRDRFAKLWNARVIHVRAHTEDKQELNGFHWFVRSKKFNVKWWLPRLKEAVELDPQLSGERYMIGKELAASADVDAHGALEVLRLLLENRDELGMVTHDLTRNAVPIVIARAIASGDEQLSGDASALMNSLGEQGYLSLEAEVNQALAGDITHDDVES